MGMEHMSGTAFVVLSVIAWSLAGFAYMMDKRKRNRS